MKQIICPDSLNQNIDNETTIFLAGTIDDGKSVDWQKDAISKIDSENCTIFNPRNSNWNKNASIDEISKQIDWEQFHMWFSDIKVFNFLPNSISPISLLELGQCLCMSDFSDTEVLVCCPIQYFRYVNVRHMCKKYSVDFFERLDDLIETLNSRLDK